MHLPARATKRRDISRRLFRSEASQSEAIPVTPTCSRYIFSRASLSIGQVGHGHSAMYTEPAGVVLSSCINVPRNHRRPQLHLDD